MLYPRLLTWYSILTIFFRCPASLDQCTDDAPRICKPYFQAKHAVSPHLEPYYDTYAAPYVQLAKPYYETVDQKVLTPTWTYAAKYGGPRLAQAQAVGQAQWEKNVQPELLKYQALAKTKYDQALAPHVDQAVAAVSPYYEVARTNALQTYHDLILPTYVTVQPYAQQAYDTASTFTTETAIPSAAWAWNKIYVFLDDTVWPQLRVLYVENVEPQLHKIGQRLGRYNGSNTQKPNETTARYAMLLRTLPRETMLTWIPNSTAAKATSTVTKPSSTVATASATPASSDAETSSTVASSSSSDVAPPKSKEAPVHTESITNKIKTEEIPAPEVVPDESETRRNARITVAQDLKDWQEKYAKAADEGAAEIDDRIDEISKRVIRRQARTMGKSLVNELNKSIEKELKTLKTEIKSIIGDVKKGSEPSGSAVEKITAAVRKAGMEIKDKSQDVRTWADNYEGELQAAVTKAAESHFKILGSIRDLALQKIGMKWAWMEGVTYKDWAKYHLLKDRFDEWEVDLKNLITSHTGLQQAQDAGRAVESEAMALAQAAAKELASLKLVAGWKLTALDDSDDFDPASTQAAAEEVLKAAAAEAEAAKAEEEAESAADDEAIPTAESVLDSTTSTATEEISSSVSPDQAPADAHDTPDLASTIVLEETPVFHDNTTEATEPAKPESAHLPVDEVGEPVDADVSAPVEEEKPQSSATAPVKSAMFGAAAQSVPSRQPILDDDTFESAESVISAMQSDIPATISSAASSAYSAAMSGAAERYSQALSIVSAQVSGTPKPAHEQILASVTLAYGNAVAAASSRLDAALHAAQQGLFATTTTDALLAVPTFAGWAGIESIAASRLNEGQAWAAQQYESARVAIGLATPTPTDISGSASSVASVAGESLSAATAAAGQNVEKLLQNAQLNYYAGLGLAQARYSEFLAAASSALSSMTATPTPTDVAGTLSSAASVASESAASVASVVGENASSVAAAGYDNASSAADAAGTLAAAGYDNVVSAADAAGTLAAAGYVNVASAAGAAGTFAHESWDAVVNQLSLQIYGQPTPTLWYDSLFGAASTYASSATEAVGGGADTVTSAAGSYAAAASEEASKQYVVVSSIVSELLVGKEPTFSESVFSRLAGAYSAATSSANSFASVASETVSSVVTEATEAVKEASQNVKDEL